MPQTDFVYQEINPKTTTRLYPFGKVPNNTITYEFTHKKPNAWFRLWQYLLLGWIWEDVNEGN